ncbi:MAG: hypothetical protein FD188_3425, partial [Ignavibacteria bacterium]
YPLYGFWMITENKSNLHKSLKLVAKNLQFQVLIIEEKFCPLKKIYLPTSRATYLNPEEWNAVLAKAPRVNQFLIDEEYMTGINTCNLYLFYLFFNATF